MKIAITGSDGFLGSYLVNIFSENGYNVMAFNRKKWDLRQKLTTKVDFDIFIHCASDTGYKKGKTEMMINNVTINKNVLQVVNNSSCKHFIYISSSSVYQGLSGIIPADITIDETKLENSYSLTKYLAEKYIETHLKKNIKLSIVRPRAIYGEGDRVLVPEILKSQVFGRLILPGNREVKTSISEVGEFTEFIKSLAISEKDNAFGNQKRVYNFSSEVRTYNELFGEIVKNHNLKGVIKIPLFIFKILYIFDKNKYSYIIDTFGNDKILKL